MTKEQWELLGKIDMRIDAQLALVRNKTFELAGQWSRKMRHSSAEFDRLHDGRRDLVAKRS